MKNIIIGLCFLPSLLSAAVETDVEGKMMETLMRTNMKLADSEVGTRSHWYYWGAVHGITQCLHILKSDPKETEGVYRDTFNDWCKE